MLTYYGYPYSSMCTNIYPYSFPTSYIWPQNICLWPKTLYHTRGMSSSPLSYPAFSPENNSTNNERYYSSLNVLGAMPSNKTNFRSEAFNIKASFQALVETNQEEALHFINEGNLSFSSLFLLRHDIEKYGVLHQLNLRNRAALSIANEIITGQKDTLHIPCSSCDYIQTVHSVLKWILETGATDDGLDNEYDKVLDIAAALLIKVYGDTSILPLITDMIFKRYTDGLFINDLVWTFFQAHDPNSLILVANRFKSTDPKDAALAHKLLSFCPSIDMGRKIPGEEEYEAFVDWMKENSLFLYFTGETFQQSTNPTPYIVVLEAKYLYKTVDLLTGKTFETFTEKESLLLDAYKKLDMDTKILLSSFSYMLHQKDISSWKTWIQYPIVHQIDIARANMEVRQ